MSFVELDLDEVFQAEDRFEREARRFDERVRAGLEKALRAGVLVGVNSRHYEDQTGLLTSMIKGFVVISTPGRAEGLLGAFTDYASYVNQGTLPHEIHGNPYLTFKAKDGTWVTVTRVFHPGTKPDGFMYRAYLEAERVLLREVEAAVDAFSGTSR